ncbi:sugar-transfer associated ATP-grasp domain-containing protein [uncultured Algoriphagus sp.]|uniref:sugar-transfer associated ATP-grasp domain-containing protein n=1 Tax=uncultured Algoriphagus sp. TaxID=417365 RepID=UPI002594C7EE|nr:sugar-transfer associated ATP-grasp domain-containing protein [uncultured Algoriphagus sp.]
MRKIQALVRRKIRRYNSNRFYKAFDKEQNIQAVICLNNLLKTIPENRLTKSDEKEIEYYSIKCLGSKAYAPMLKAYAVFHGEFREGLITNSYYYRYVLGNVNGPLRILSRERHLTKKILQAEEIPDLGYFMCGNWFITSGEKISFKQALDYFFSVSERVVIKTNGSLRGNGFFFLTQKEFEVFDFTKYSGLVVQYPIQQHEFFSEFCSTNVATIRITTVKMDSFPAKSIGNYLRLGRLNENRITQEASISVGINENGSLTKFGLDKDCNMFTFHPDSNLIFDGKVIPGYNQLLMRCEELHEREPNLGIIGWDVALDKDSKMNLLEWNTFHPSISHSEFFSGPNFLKTSWSKLWRINK